ncbi:ABC transporter ATP-binding protein [Massilia sp. MB5]|uniref:ABC transporter ATP-binding protein n=1 Tax=Massilia sp. MB5 TaxID=2919578 RepID=UPI001F10B32F|nr:ABC transporter ATP-binding protein [Massilia sp. MB5]UMR30398.1 ABC transporter ATP-binding protein [Massilia sp. MB5]
MSASHNNALELRGLSKRFDRPAVHALDLSVRRGEIYALLGANGAGKTTTLRMATGLLLPDTGSVHILGIDLHAHPEAAKRPLAYLPDEPLLYGKLTALEYLAFMAGLWNMPAAQAAADADDLLALLGLAPHARQLTESYSRGMKQKLALAGALIHKPDLIILDEPLTGLDAHASRQVKDLLHRHTAAGGTVVITTHILEVAERMADRIGILQNGRLIGEGSLDQLRTQAQQRDASLEDVFLSLTESSHASAV